VESLNSNFAAAKAAFDENIRAIKQPSHSPELWNLSTGLRQLAEGLELELVILRRKIEAIDSDVKSIR
jgi:hypothetical protein